MDINYWAVVVCGVAAMGLGALWYGPMFGKKWLEIVGTTAQDTAAREAMMQRTKYLYLIQFILVLFQVWVLAYYIKGWTEVSALQNALWLWAAFVMPTVATTSMWNNDTPRISWMRFSIQAGYQFMVFVIFALILGYWQ